MQPRQLVPRGLMHWSAVTFVRVLVLALRFLPVRAIPTCGHLVGRLAQALMPQRRSILRANMVATGYVPDHLEQQAYSHIGSTLLITLLPVQRSTELLARTAIAGGPVAAAAEAFSTDCRLGGVIVCSAHVGVWELVPAALSPYVPRRARRHGAIIYQPLHDAPLDRWLLCWRTRAAGMALLPAHGSGSALRRALRTGGLVGLVADQRPAAGCARVPVILLGQASELSPGLAALHRSTGAPVWFAVVLVERSQTVCGQGGTSLALRRRSRTRATCSCRPTRTPFRARCTRHHRNTTGSIVGLQVARIVWRHSILRSTSAVPWFPLGREYTTVSAVRPSDETTRSAGSRCLENKSEKRPVSCLVAAPARPRAHTQP